MKKKMRRIGGIAVLGIILVLAAVSCASMGGGTEEASTPPITDDQGNVIPGSINRIETVVLGGTPQSITIRGADSTNPVLLYLHGGPGLPSSPWASWNNYHAELEENFVMVHWDQRGAGKSYSENLTVDDMHVSNFVSDTLELANLLREKFHQDKIFLWGHSWGASLGFETLQVSTEPFYAYFASAVRPEWNASESLSYELGVQLAEDRNDKKALKKFESIAPFDPENYQHIGTKDEVLSALLVCNFHTEGLGDAFMSYAMKGKSPETPKSLLRQTIDGVNFTRATLAPEILETDYDHTKDFPVSDIPVFFFAGRYDYVTPGTLAEEYYEMLEAPMKSFTWFENSAHNVLYDESTRFNETIIGLAREVLGQ